MQEILQRITKQSVTVRLEMVSEAAPESLDRPANNSPSNPATERRKQLQSLPLFRKASEVLGAQIWHVDDEFKPDATPRAQPSAPEDPDET